MARAKIIFAKGITIEAKKIIFSVLNDNRDLAQFVAEEVKQTVRDGIDPAGGEFPALSKEWIERREKLAAVNSTHKDFSPSRSNLTFTGQLMDSLKTILKLTSNSAKIIMEYTGTHKGYIGLKGKRGKAISNKRLAGYLQESGRNTGDYELSKDQANTLADKIAKLINKKLK